MSRKYTRFHLSPHFRKEGQSVTFDSKRGGFSFVAAADTCGLPAMPPPVPDAPRHACTSYRICTKQQANIRDGYTRKRLSFCTRCSTNKIRCSHPNCDSLDVPCFGKSLPNSLCRTLRDGPRRLQESSKTARRPQESSKTAHEHAKSFQKFPPKNRPNHVRGRRSGNMIPRCRPAFEWYLFLSRRLEAVPIMLPERFLGT